MLLVLQRLNVACSWGYEPKNVISFRTGKDKETNSSPESPERNTVLSIP